MADRPTLPAALLDRMAAAMAARWRELAAATVEDSPEGHCADLARVAAAALLGWGTYRTAWESGYGAGRDDEAAGVSTERTARAALSTPPDTEETTT